MILSRLRLFVTLISLSLTISTETGAAPRNDPNRCAQPPDCQTIFIGLSADQRMLQQTALVTRDGRIRPVAEATAVIRETVDAMSKQQGPDRNLIIFIHGRGKFPGKAFSQSLLCDLERDYRASVIMFHWPSWDGLAGFPDQAAIKAANDFALLMTAVTSFQKRFPVQTQAIRWSLLTQSMGSLVLEAYLNSDFSPEEIGRFDSVVICASASAVQQHDQWLQRLTFSDEVYVLFNRHDLLLRINQLLHFSRFPKFLGTLPAEDKRAGKIMYIDLTGKVGLRHRYYLARCQAGSSLLAETLNRAFRGTVPLVWSLPLLTDDSHERGVGSN